MNIAVIGGGWAGLAATFDLARAGHSVSVFEASRTLGGRARRVYSRALDAHIDNGQHILLGAYTETLSLINELGPEAQQVLYREALDIRMADGSFQLKAVDLPAPLHLLGAIITARGLSLTQRLRLAWFCQRLKQQNWKTTAGLTVAQWLKQGRQSGHVIRRFWNPLCLAALNTPIHEACAQMFANVLRDSLGGTKQACDVLIPRVDLSALWPECVGKNMPTQDSIVISLGRAIHQLRNDKGWIYVDDQPFDAAIIATNAPSAHRLLNSLPQPKAAQRYLAMLAAFDYVPIATITLLLERPWNLPHAMLMLREDPERLQFGQWLFDRGMSSQTTQRNGADLSVQAKKELCMLNIVISDAGALRHHPRQDIVAATILQIQEQTKDFPPLPAVVASEMITEKRATFAARPGLARPANATPWRGVWVAGDWTDTGYPGVLEGAVRSGRNAASLILQRHNS